MLATDGLWDNLSEEAILDQLKRLGGHNVQVVEFQDTNLLKGSVQQFGAHCSPSSIRFTP